MNAALPTTVARRDAIYGLNVVHVDVRTVTPVFVIRDALDTDALALLGGLVRGMIFILNAVIQH